MPRHSSYIKLSQSALLNNLDFIRRKIGSRPVISSVVKANAFGHGISDFVPMAEACGIRHFSVASGQEAEEVMEARTTEADIMIMGILYPEDLPWVIEEGIEFFVYDYPRLERSAEVAGMTGRKARIHLELETGGHRTGLEPDELNRTIDFLAEHRDRVNLVGVCTHYAGIESLSNQFRISRQEETFEKLSERILEAGLKPRYFHTACSAAALAFPHTVRDLVRVGTAQYGIWPSPDIRNIHRLDSNGEPEEGLQQVLSWKSDVMHIKEVQKNQFIGYGTAFQAPRDMRVAVVPIGFSNGYARTLSNRGHVLIRGSRAPVVGSVTMNVFMADVTDIPGVSLRDEVVLIGRQGDQSISISSFTDFTNAINNEFISRLPTAIPRQVES